MNLVVEEDKKINNLLKKTISNLKNDLKLANSKIENKDNLIKDLQEENVILLDNSAELRSKVTDLENNIELLSNNSKNNKIKELISDSESQN